jgi:hypothetical protein
MILSIFVFQLGIDLLNNYSIFIQIISMNFLNFNQAVDIVMFDHYQALKVAKNTQSAEL